MICLLSDGGTGSCEVSQGCSSWLVSTSSSASDLSDSSLSPWLFRWRILFSFFYLNSQGESEEADRTEADQEVERGHEEQTWLSSHEPVPPPDNKQIIFSQSDLLFYSTPTSETDLESLRVEWHWIFVLKWTDLLASHHKEFSPSWY